MTEKTLSSGSPVPFWERTVPKAIATPFKLIGRFLGILVGPGTALFLFAYFVLLVGLYGPRLQATLPELEPVWRWVEEHVGPATALAIALGVAVNGLREIFEHLWQKSVRGTLEKGFREIAQGIIKNLRPIAQSISASRVEDLTKDMTNGELDRVVLPAIFRRRYGDVALEPDHLLSFLQRLLAKQLEPSMPYRADSVASIRLKEVPGRIGLHWTETYSYKIVCSQFRSRNRTDEDGVVTFPLSYESKAKLGSVKDIRNGSLKLLVKVEDDVLVNLPDELEIVGDRIKSKNQYLEVNYDPVTREFEYSYKRDVPITAHKTKVHVVEENQLEPDEDWYMLTTPICEHGRSINISFQTSGYKFDSIRVADRTRWNFVPNPPAGDTFDAQTKHWILPGLVLFCKWSKGK